LVIKWTVIIYGGGVVITFLIGLGIFGGALTSFFQAFVLATFYAVFWPLGIVLLFFR
jgi:hypothetical protein